MSVKSVKRLQEVATNARKLCSYVACVDVEDLEDFILQFEKQKSKIKRQSAKIEILQAEIRHRDAVDSLPSWPKESCLCGTQCAHVGCCLRKCKEAYDLGLGQ